MQKLIFFENPRKILKVDCTGEVKEELTSPVICIRLGWEMENGATF